MKIAKQKERTFQGADSFMLESARVTYGLLLNDLPAFTAFDHTIDATYCNNFLDALETAYTISSDNSILGQQRQKVAEVNLLMQRAIRKCTDVLYFAKKAFPKGAMIKTFGSADFVKAKNNRIKMIDLLDTMVTASETNKQALLDAGFSKASIAEIDVLREQLDVAFT